MNALTLGTSAIRQLDGLYSLNDLHKAAGGEKSQQPANFMRLDTTTALITEISNSSDVRSFQTTTGRTGGTYVCRELVYAYAMWISPKFNLQVIRAFDALQHHKPHPTTKALPMKTGRFSFLSVDGRFIAPLVDLPGDPFEIGRRYAQEYLATLRSDASDIHNDRAMLIDAIMERLHDLGGTAAWRDAFRGHSSPAYAFRRIVGGMFWEMDRGVFQSSPAMNDKR